MSRILLGLKSVLVLAIGLNALGTYSHIARSMFSIIGLKSVLVLAIGLNALRTYSHIVRKGMHGLNSVSVLCPCAEYIENLPTHSAQTANLIPGQTHSAQSYHRMIAADLAELLDSEQGHVGDSWTDKAAAVKMCD